MQNSSNRTLHVAKNVAVTPDPSLAAAIRTTCDQLRDLAMPISSTLIDASTNPHVDVAENEILAVRSYLVRARELLRELERLVGRVETMRDANR